MKRGLKSQMLDLFAGTSPSADRSESAPLVAPQPPLAKRLNRNALTVAAAIMGMTVIACLVVLRGGSSAPPARTSTDPNLNEAASPTFLDHPLRENASPRTLPAQTATSRDNLADAAGAQLPIRAPSSDYPVTPGASASPRTAAAGSSPQPREQAFEAALKRSAIGRDGATSAEGERAALNSSGSLANEEAHLVAYGDSVMRGATQRSTASSATTTLGAPRSAFMQQAGDLGGRSTTARLEPAASQYVLRAGTVIPAMLLTAITSDLPGDCVGQVSRNVYDSQTQRTVLIPKGSKLMCRYDDQVVAGQGRLLVAWTRLMLPDGRSMTLPGLALKDAQGQTGAKGDVDNHTRRVFGRALLLSAIGAGAQLSQPRQASILAAPSTGQVMAGAVGQELSNVALEILRRGMDQPPTITVPQGQVFNVFLNGDLVFDGPYDETR